MEITQMHIHIKVKKNYLMTREGTKGTLIETNKLSILLLTSKLFDFNNSFSLASERSTCSPCFNCNSSLDLNPI